MSKRYPGIYRIVCQTTGDFYVGSSAYLYSRKSEHWQKLRKNIHSNIHLQRAFNKYGEDTFAFEVLERPSVEKLIEREQYWIDVLEPTYNIRKIAESNLGLKASEIAKERRRQAWLQASPEEQEKAKQVLAEGRQKRLELIANGEWQHSPETIEEIKAARAKQEITPAMLEALKQGQEIRKRVNPKPRLGMKSSEETRRKQSEAAKGRKHTPETLEKLRIARRGKKQSEESNRKRSETLKANKRVWTEEQKAQIAEKNKETWSKKTAEEKRAIAQKRYTKTGD